MAVLSLVEFRNRETVKLLRAMLALAERGEIHDVNVIYMLDGEEKNARAGLYRRSPAHALRSAVRQTINLAHEDTRG